MKIQFLKNLIKRNNKNTTSNRVSGFTLVEAMIAILILSISVSAMLQVTAATANGARYANNEVTASYLLQEAVDAIRNSRDTIAIQQGGSNGWASFQTAYSLCLSSANGCYIDLGNFNPSSPNYSIKVCTNEDCINQTLDTSSNFNYDSTGSPLFYTYNSSSTTTSSNFNRRIFMSPSTTNPTDEIKVTVRVDWKNGNLTKTQTLETYLLNWYN